MKKIIKETPEFDVSLISYPVCNEGDFLDMNCTFVAKGFFIYEGDEYLLTEEVPGVKIIGNGFCPCLADLSQDELIEGCKSWFGIDINKIDNRGVLK